MIDSRTIREVTGLDAPEGARFDRLGWANSAAPNTLSFVEQPRFLAEIEANANVAGVFAPPSLADRVRGLARPIQLIECEDPRWAYYTLHNHVAERDCAATPAVIAPSARIHPAAYVAEHNVTIGERTVVAPNATILPDSHIGADCVIQAGVVIGSVGFEQKRTSRGLLSVFHDGEVRIGDRVEIGANCCVDKGFRDRPTVLGDDVRLDNLVHVAHSVRIGRGTFVTAGVIFAGSCQIGEEAWLSINASVAPGLKLGDRSFVSMAAAVAREVGDDEQVTGNLAVPHKTFLKIFKRQIRDAND